MQNWHPSPHSLFSLFWTAREATERTGDKHYRPELTSTFFATFFPSISAHLEVPSKQQQQPLAETQSQKGRTTAISSCSTWPPSATSAVEGALPPLCCCSFTVKKGGITFRYLSCSLWLCMDKSHKATVIYYWRPSERERGVKEFLAHRVMLQPNMETNWGWIWPGLEALDSP